MCSERRNGRNDQRWPRSYSVNAASNATLVFSSVGFVSQEVAVDGRTVINISLVAVSATLMEWLLRHWVSEDKPGVWYATTTVEPDELPSTEALTL